MSDPTIRIRTDDLVRVLDGSLSPLLAGVSHLLLALADCPKLPGSVMDAADEIRRAVAALGGRDIGPPP